jgi:hypothetical protein
MNMPIIKYLNKINNKINNNDSLFSIDLKIQLEYLSKFPEPKDDIQRSYFQFMCQRFLENGFLSILKEIVSGIIIIPCFVVLYARKKREKSANKSNLGTIIYSGIHDIIPGALIENFEEIKYLTFGANYYITGKDLLFLIKLLFRYPFSYYFVLKSTYRISIYRPIIDEYNPRAIIVSSEFAFTSSLMTAYCETNHIEHINVMHGEKLLWIRDSFFRFHKCYVWDDHYISIFQKLLANKNNFVIARPPSLRVQIPQMPKKYDFTYYLTCNTYKELIRLREALLLMKADRKKICIRLHPRYSDPNMVRKIFEGFTIESSDLVSINESFAYTKGVISDYSTVLYQAHLCGLNVIIDDISAKDKYKQLNELRYIMIEKPHEKLSDLF